MFAYGGLLKLFGDLAALVGPISITQIVEYIEINNSSITPIKYSNANELHINTSSNIGSSPNSSGN